MKRVVGIRFRKADPIKYADAGELALRPNNYVVVAADNGQEFGWVVREPSDMVYLQPEDGPLLTIARKATASDFGRWQQNQELEEQAFALARGKTREQALPISAEGLAGACGRLRCCLRYEYEQYRQVNRLLPRTNEEVGTPKGRATVIVGHRIRETVSVRYPDDQVLEWPLAQIQRFPPSKN